MSPSSLSWFLKKTGSERLAFKNSIKHFLPFSSPRLLFFDMQKLFVLRNSFFFFAAYFLSLKSYPQTPVHHRLCILRRLITKWIWGAQKSQILNNTTLLFINEVKYIHIYIYVYPCECICSCIRVCMPIPKWKPTRAGVIGISMWLLRSKFLS